MKRSFTDDVPRGGQCPRLELISPFFPSISAWDKWKMVSRNNGLSERKCLNILIPGCPDPDELGSVAKLVLGTPSGFLIIRVGCITGDASFFYWLE